MTGAPVSLHGQRIVPVVVIDDAARAVELAEALLAGGIGCAEFTLRTPAALAAIEAAAGVAGFVAGVGTVLTPDHVRQAVDAGARFGVAPGFDDEVVASAVTHGLEFVPGVATPTELSRALRAGVDHVKVYPAGVLGGPAYLDALAGPFPTARFLPSGGVSAASAREYAGHPSVFAISGSWMVPRDAIATGDVGLIEARARAAVAALAGTDAPAPTAVPMASGASVPDGLPESDR